jgi:TP901 family phage tail tape measure protein
LASTTVLYRLVAQDGASRTMNRVGGSASKLEGGLGKLGKAAKAAGLALGAVGAGALKAAHSAAEFQTAMTRVQTQAGATAKDVQTLSKQVLALGTKTQQGPQQLAESLYHLKSVGMDNASAMRALKEASDLAAVGGADLEETTNALAGAWRTGIRGAKSFHGAVSTVNAIIGAGNMRMEDFNAAIGTGILPSAKEFGLSLKQVGAALALFTDEGIPADAAATRLRMSFSLLGAPSGAAENQLKKIHLTGLQLAQAMRSKDGLIGAIQLLKDHLDASGLSAAQESQLLSRAFGGGRSSSAIIGMVNNLDVLKRKQDQVNRSTGKFDDAVRTQRKTAEAQWKLLTSNLEVISVKIGTKILPPLTSFVHYITTTAAPAVIGFGRTLVERFVPVGAIGHRFKAVTDTVSDFIHGLRGDQGKKAARRVHLAFEPTLGPGPFLKQAPKEHKIPLAFAPPKPAGPFVDQRALDRAAPLSAAQRQGMKLRQALTGGLASAGDDDARSSLLGKALGQAVTWLGDHTAGISKKIAAALGGIDWVDVGKTVGVQALPFSVGFVDEMFTPLFQKSFWSKHWADILIAAVSIIPVGKAGGALARVGERIPWGEMFGGIGRAFEHIPWGRWFGGIGRTLDRIPWGRVFAWARWIGRTGGEALASSRRFAGRLASDLAEGFRTRLPGVAQRLSDELTLLPVRIGDLGRAMRRKGAELIDKLGTGIVENVPLMKNKFFRGIAKFWGRFTLYKTGVQLVQGLLSGIGSGLSHLGGWLKAHMVDPLVNWVESLLGIKSPSRLFAAIGRQIPAGLRSGIAGGVKGIGGWLRGHVINPALAAFGGAGGWLIGRGHSLVSGLKSGTMAGAKGIAGWERGHVIDPALRPYVSAGSWLHSKGSALVSGLKSGIMSGAKGIGGWLKSHLIDPVVSAVKHYFGIKSPSRVFAGIGGHLVAGLVKGLAQHDSAAVVKRIFGSFPSALTAMLSKGLVGVGSLPAKALKALGGALNSFLGLGGHAKSSTAVMDLGKRMMLAMGYGQAQWPALQALWAGESGWNPRARNPTSGAYGIPQALPASKMASAGKDWMTNPATQIKWGLSYIRSRYGSPLDAYEAWRSRNPHWYAKGTGGAAPGWAWVGERGPELVRMHGGETVLNHGASMAAARTGGLPGYASGTIDNAAARVAAAREALERAKARHVGIQAAETRLKAAKQELANAKRSAKASISNTIANGFLKTLETGTSSKIATAVKGITSKLLGAGYSGTAKSVQKQATKLEGLATKKASVANTIAAANKYASDQASNLGDFLGIGDTSATSINALVSQMQKGQKTAGKFASEVKDLRRRGINKTLLAQLADSGPGSNLAALLAGASQSDIARLNKLAASQSKLTTSFGRELADAMYDSGRHAGDGFLAGLKATEKDLQKQMDSLATALVKAIKKKLKIHSPSRVFRDDIGRQLPLGMAAGMDAHRHVVAAAARRMADTAVGTTWRSPAVAASARRAAEPRMEQAGGQFTGDLYLDSGEFLGKVRGVVRPMIRESEQRQAHRARVGRAR